MKTGKLGVHWGQGDLRKEILKEGFPKVYLQQLKKYKVSFERKSCKRAHAAMRYKMLESSEEYARNGSFLEVSEYFPKLPYLYL